MKIVFCSAEVVPFTKTGGLADVAGSLPIALEKLGHEVIIIKPYYKSVKYSDFKHHAPDDVSVAKIGQNIKVYLIGNEHYFGREGLYGDHAGDYPDNLERFSYYCQEALRLLKRLGETVDIIHCHDWHTSLIPVLLKTKYRNDPVLKGARSVFTIHNLAYQGIFPKEKFDLLGVDPDLFDIDGFEFYNQINMMKAGIIFCDYVTTVSPKYAKEIQTKEYGCGLDGVLRNRREAVVGILNGIDYDLWDPMTDPLLDFNYSAETWREKSRNKLVLQKEMGLPQTQDVPLFGFVGRLCHQKGLDLIFHVINQILRSNIQLVFVGTGSLRYHRLLEEAISKHPKQVAAHLKFGEQMARRIYAGSDLFLMPSVYEPCGLGQMISLSYGTVPLVHRTGGLADTIQHYDEAHDRGNGFVFSEYTEEAFVHCVQQATTAFGHKEHFEKLIQRAFKCRFSWEQSAQEYVRVYETCLSLA